MLARAAVHWGAQSREVAFRPDERQTDCVHARKRFGFRLEWDRHRGRYRWVKLPQEPSQRATPNGPEPQWHLVIRPAELAD